MRFEMRMPDLATTESDIRIVRRMIALGPPACLPPRRARRGSMTQLCCYSLPIAGNKQIPVCSTWYRSRRRVSSSGIGHMGLKEGGGREARGQNQVVVGS
jgi:hypothetical protein